MDRWTEEVGKANLVAGGLPAEAVRPFEVDTDNLAGETASKSTNLWSRMLPVLLLLWAMTGAFYPAIDLCAGEKERGTLETLLSSPAERSEIVLGKLLTIMIFSMATAALNLICVGVTGSMVFRQMAGFGGPPVLAVVWLSLALVPVSALVQRALPGPGVVRPQHEGRPVLPHAADDALAAAGRAADESGRGAEPGQQPGAADGHGAAAEDACWKATTVHALQYLPVVLAVTLGACWLAVRWAVEQFNKESVLFRESERFSLGIWLRHLRRDRGPLPSAGEGIVLRRFDPGAGFVSVLVLPPQDDFAGFAR